MKKELTLEDSGRIDFIVAVNSDILKILQQHLELHGPDDEIIGIVSAALTLTINNLEKTIPGIKEVILQIAR